MIKIKVNSLFISNKSKADLFPILELVLNYLAQIFILQYHLLLIEVCLLTSIEQSWLPIKLSYFVTLRLSLEDYSRYSMLLSLWLLLPSSNTLHCSCIYHLWFPNLRTFSKTHLLNWRRPWFLFRRFWWGFYFYSKDQEWVRFLYLSWNSESLDFNHQSDWLGLTRNLLVSCKYHYHCP